HRDFLRLARAVADPALAVADDDERGEREVLAALDDLRDAVDMDDAVDQLPTLRVALLLALARRPRSAPSTAAHRFVVVIVPNLLEFQAAVGGRVGQGLDLAVVDVAAAVEDDLRDALRLGPLGHELADPGRGRAVGALAGLLHVALERRGVGHGAARLVVDHLRVDVLAALEDREARPRGRALDLAPDAAAHRGAGLCPCLWLGPGLLPACFADLAADDLVGVLDALGLVRIRDAELPDLRGCLPDLLPVGARDRELPGLRVEGDADPVRDREVDRVRVAEGEDDRLAL